MEVDFCSRGRIVQVDLDFGFDSILALVLLEDPGQSAIAGVVVDMGADLQMSVTAEFKGAHSRVADDLDVPIRAWVPETARKADIDELFVGIGEGWVMAGVGNPFSAMRLAHLLKSVGEPGLGEAGSRLKLAGPSAIVCSTWTL